MAKFVAVALLVFLSLWLDRAHADCRSHAQKHRFDVQQGYPHGRPGFVVDHICPLSCGGIDAPSNMQYQTRPESRAKDRWETTLTGCAKLCTPENSTPDRRVFNCRS